MSHETSPESPQNDSGVTPDVTTPAGDSEHGSNALGPASGVFPDVRLWPDGVVTVHGTGEWVDTVVAVRRDQDGFVCAPPSPPDCYREPSAEAQRMVPVGPLLELVDRWRRARNMHREHALTVTEDDDRPDWDDDVMALEYELRATELGRLLASLLGETTGEAP